MPNLQEHMLSVAAVASLICDNFNEPLPKDEIVAACLLHDMGNIIKFKLERFPEFLEPEGMEYWREVQNEYIKKYGKDEYRAHDEIIREIGVSERIVELIQSISFLGAPKTALDSDWSRKITQYCDGRVDPHGIVSLEERFADLRKRYAHHGENTPERSAFENALRSIEKEIFSKCSIKPEDINKKTAAPVISALKNFVIK